jgi:hypothetical protein
LWDLLNDNGILFCRFASLIAWPDNASHGAFAFLPTRTTIVEIAQSLNAQFIDPLKTTVVDQSRTMTTLVLKK